MMFQSNIISSQEQSAKAMKYSNALFKVETPQDVKVEEIDKDQGDLTVWFNKEKIILNGEAFDWSDDGIIIQ